MMDLEKRAKFNSWMFIFAYIVMGVLSGVVLDTMVTFLDSSTATKGIAASMSIIMGVGFYGGAIMLLIIPKFGYKKVLACSPIAFIIGMVLITKIRSVAIIAISASIVMIGVCMFDAILSPYLTCYTTEENREKIFSTTLWTNIAGMIVGTWSGGFMITYRFAKRLGLSYGQGKLLTEKIKTFSPIELQAYMGAHRDALLTYAFVAILCLIPILFIKEIPEDYRRVKKATNINEKKDWKAFLNKYIVMFVVFAFLIRLGASLITPYFSVFLSRMGIDRATTSALISYQYLSMVVFIMISPWIVKHIGRVMTLGGLALVSVPFMLIIANGALFGSHMVIAVGLGLFLRSGFMNAAQPVQQALPMEFVTKEARPAYNSVIYIVQGLGQVIAGLIGKEFIFNLPNGYGKAYYITGTIYIIASILLLVVYTKKYNRPPKKEETSILESAVVE
ncbi:Major Facilitator Superfamily protein [Cetobacterium ceti]|uniref:Major Facilitator Superfamily protein n=1 Tax=Cetobacterium ceti TaxID=180163 RepID=A0A1T4P683_9FUSO|nr:MFS transporter [Cetobacterium ceti]SJZ86959.1 Major Facilitator Superfamily protein [Cetobacterium ceti]